MKNILESFEEVCKILPNVYKVENNDNYLKISTEILFKKAENYLNLYILLEDDYICLSDSNSVYSICDGFYDISEEILLDFANKVGLDFADYRFTKIVNLENIEEEINKFEKLKDLIESREF